MLLERASYCKAAVPQESPLCVWVFVNKQEHRGLSKDDFSEKLVTSVLHFWSLN